MNGRTICAERRLKWRLFAKQEIFETPAAFWRRALIALWSVYWAVGIVTVYPLDNARELATHRIYLGILESFAAWILLRISRAIWTKHWSWTRKLSVAASSALVLGYICSVCAELMMPWTYPEIHSVRAAFLLGTYAAGLTIFPLIACAVVYFAALQWQEARDREVLRLRLEGLARDAELRALRAELTPHFLFNTLNGISTLVSEGANEEAQTMIARLGDFLRATIHGSGLAEITLQQELHYVQDYLAIESVRLAERLRVSIDVDPEIYDLRIPNLVLQPLIENAIRHGIAPFPDGGDIAIRGWRRGECAVITLSNSFATVKSVVGDSGVGLKNTRERLLATYGGASSFSAASRAGRWEVMLELPLHAGAL